MAKERPPDWMPSFNYGSGRAPHPSSSAPGLRISRSHSNRTGSPPSSDEESSASITNRCSPKAVHVMVSKLSEFKKQLVRDMGFGGILELPCINKVNLKLSAWLLSKLDTEVSELVFSEARRIYIHEKDVGIVFGIPCGEIDVASMDITPEQIDSIKMACGINSKDSRSFRGLENILEKHLDDRSSRIERDSFKIAFVIYVMGHLLAPSAKYDCVHLDFWGALKDTELLERMNWCRYVYSHVLDGAQKAREEFIRKNRVTNLFGCHLFLQVLFLDNVDIRGLNKSHRELPRIKLFDAESLKRMTMMCESRGGNDFNSFIGIRPPEVTAYTRHWYQSKYIIPRRASMPLPSPSLPAVATQEGPSEVLSAETYTFREHSDFSAYIRTRYPTLTKLYAIDYLRLHNAKMFREITMFRSSIMKQNAMLVDWLVSNVHPVELQKIHKKPSPSRPHGSNPSTRDTTTVQTEQRITTPERPAQCEGVQVGTSDAAKRPAETHCGKEVKKPRADFDPPSFELGIDNSPACASFVTPKAAVVPMQAAISPIPFPTSSLSGYETSYSSPPLSPISATKKNAREIVQDMIDTIEDGSTQNDYVLFGQQISEEFSPQPFPLSPDHPTHWPTDEQQHRPDPEVLEMLHIYVKDSQHIDRRSLWIVHPLPRQLVVSAQDIKDNFLSQMLTDFTIVDVIMRRLNQLDVTVNQGCDNLRWRHFLETDFAMQSIGGFHPELTQSVLNQFMHTEYSVPSCRMIIVPVLVEDIWTAYMFDMNESIVHIIDPGHSDGRYAAHAHFQQLLSASIVCCFNAFFTGCKLPSARKRGVQYPKLCDSLGSEDSAFCMLHLARHYNGVELQSQIKKEDMQSIRKQFLFEALSLDHNEAVLPSMLARLIRQD